MKILLAMLLFLAFPKADEYPVKKEQDEFTKVKIEGRVVDADTQQPLSGVSIQLNKLNLRKSTDLNGEFYFEVKPGTYTLSASFIGYTKFSKKVFVPKTGLKNVIIKMEATNMVLEEQVVSESERLFFRNDAATMSMKGISPGFVSYSPSTEEYSTINENVFKWAQKEPLSTFSIDVDGASYSNIRRMIMDGELPVYDAVRVEEMINYFSYDYPLPKGDNPFSVHTEVAPAPWNRNHQLVQIGIQGKKIETENLPPSNLVFLLDVSGSMNSPNKLPLLKKGFKLLVNQLREEDHVAIVVYAGSSGLVLPSTSGTEKETILAAINNLHAGGSTAGAAGIELAYKVAKEHFNADGNNRVILATDGDFNVGISSNSELIKLIESKRDDGIFLSVLGFGTGNLKDSKMEQIANNGNGNYYYIDNLLEAKKVLVNEMGSTLHTIAKDVKIQVEFNPQNVQAYRLIGYENRLLNDEDFNDDTKDAGELGSGHTVTALYEVIPHGVEIDNNLMDVDPLKYQQPNQPNNDYSGELMTVKLRYKNPDENNSNLLSSIVHTSKDETVLSENLAFASSVASFGMILRDSRFKGDSNFETVIKLARMGKGEDEQGYRSEYIKLVELAKLLYHGEAKN